MFAPLEHRSSVGPGNGGSWKNEESVLFCFVFNNANGWALKPLTLPHGEPVQQPYQTIRLGPWSDPKK